MPLKKIYYLFNIGVYVYFFLIKIVCRARGLNCLLALKPLHFDAHSYNPFVLHPFFFIFHFFIKAGQLGAIKTRENGYCGRKIVDLVDSVEKKKD